jgi:hypothetical protein
MMAQDSGRARSPDGALSLNRASEMLPSLACCDHTSHHVCDSEGFPERSIGLSGGGAVSQFEHLFLRELGRGVLDAFVSAAKNVDGVSNIFLKRNPLEILQAVVVFVAVPVIGLAAFFWRTREGEEDETGDREGSSFSSFAESHSKIAIWVSRLSEKSTRTNVSSAYLDPNLAPIRHGVNAFVAGDREPDSGRGLLYRIPALDRSSDMAPALSSNDMTDCGRGYAERLPKGRAGFTNCGKMSDLQDLFLCEFGDGILASCVISRHSSSFEDGRKYFTVPEDTCPALNSYGRRTCL